MSEIIIGIISVSLIVGHAFYVVEANKQISELTRLIKSKDVIEFASARNIESNEPMKKSTEEYTSMENLSDSDFLESLKRSLDDKS